MLKEALQWIVGESKPELTKIGNLTYTSKPLTLVTDPSAPTFTVHTLTGFVDFVKIVLDTMLPEERVVAKVVTPGRVVLTSSVEDEFGRLQCYADASLLQSEKGFRFDSFMDRESFVIGLQSQFAQTGDVSKVLEIASSLTDTQVTTAQDDGISQEVTLKRGVASLKKVEIVKGRVSLQPFRTFREVDQPVSEFIFRLKSNEGVPACALFEADGGKWQLDAMLTIKTWLEAQNLGVRVVA